MEACSVARIMSLRGLAMHPRDLCSLVLRVLRGLLARSPSLLKKFRKEPQLIEAATGRSPELPQDSLMDIFALLEIPDLVRAGSVCSSWRSAYTSLRSLGQYNRPQTPCLLYTSASAGEKVACLYSLAEKRVYKLTLPDPPIRSRHLIGSSHGWLVTADERSELHLVNPMTGEQIALPSVITIDRVKPIFDDAGAIHKYEVTFPNIYGDEYELTYTPDNLRGQLYVKAFVFSDPSTGSYIVALIHNPYDQVSFARAGDCKWTWLPSDTRCADCIYMDGLLYVLRTDGGIVAFDLTGPAITMEIVTMKNYFYNEMYIVKAPWGDVLQVGRDTKLLKEGNDEDAWVTCTWEIVVYKVDMAAKGLVEINDLHDHVLFLGHNQSQCLTAEDYPQLKANHVYFTDDEDGISSYRNNRRDMGVFNLENNSCEEIVSPELWCRWPAPIWITANLTMMNWGLNK